MIRNTEESGIKVDPEYDAIMKGPATPGTHTDVKEVPVDEIERPDGKVQKGDKVLETTEETEVQARWRQAYELAVNEEKTWDQIAEIMDIAKNQTWMFVGKYCSFKGIENPTKKKGKKPSRFEKRKAISKASKTSDDTLIEKLTKKSEGGASFEEVAKADELMEAEESYPPQEWPNTGSKYDIKNQARIITEGDADFEKTTKDHTHTAIVHRHNRTFTLCFAGQPRDRDIDRAIANEMKS